MAKGQCNFGADVYDMGGREVHVAFIEFVTPSGQSLRFIADKVCYDKEKCHETVLILQKILMNVDKEEVSVYDSDGNPLPPKEKMT